MGSQEKTRVGFDDLKILFQPMGSMSKTGPEIEKPEKLMTAGLNS